jgi:cyanobactin maturation PatA/PatG family protease
MEEQDDTRRGGRATVHPWAGADRYTVALRETLESDPSDGSVTLAEGTLGDDLVYALGQIGLDFPTGSRRTSFAQRVDDPAVLDDPARFLAHLDANPSDAAAVQWTLDLDGVPIYVLQPSGPFASDVYALLRQFMREQIEEGVERVSIPGVVSGSARHRSGLVLPVVNPTLRGMYSWTTQALVSAVMEAAPAEGTEPKADDESKRAGVSNFLDRVYFELRNVGRDPHERAVNFAATNALEVERVYERAINEEMELETIDVEPSGLCAPGSNCWDVKLLFFFPARPSVRRLYRFTIDVADVVPAIVGRMRSWAVR